MTSEQQKLLDVVIFFLQRQAEAYERASSDAIKIKDLSKEEARKYIIQQLHKQHDDALEQLRKIGVDIPAKENNQ